MSDQREDQELDQRRRGLHNELRDIIKENRRLSQETKDLKGSAEEMRDLTEQIKTQQSEVRDGAGKSSGDSDSGIQGGKQK